MIRIDPYTFSESMSLYFRIEEFYFEQLYPSTPSVIIEPSLRRFFSEEEVLSRLFPDETSRRQLDEEQEQWDKNLLDRIRKGKVNKIRGWRILKGMDQITLSKRTNIRQPNLSRMEKLGSKTSLPNLKKIAEALKIDIKELL